MGFFSRQNPKHRAVLRRNWLTLSLAVSLQLAFMASAQAVTVTAHVGHTPTQRQRGKSLEASKIVLWLTPLSSSLSERAASTLSELQNHFQLLQVHKHFEPHLLVIPVGSAVDFPNKDPFFHNVFSLFDGKRFDLGLYETGRTRTVRFDRPGVSFIFCNIHPQMSAVILAMKTPYFAVSDESGGVEIRGVPPGRYRLELWSERALLETLKGLEREVVITEETGFLGTFLVKESGDLLAGHKNKYGDEYDTPSPSTPAYHQPE